MSAGGHEFKLQAFPQGNYVGEFQSGERHGMGRFEYFNGNLYVGSWQNDRKSGYIMLRVQGRSCFAQTIGLP